MKKYLIIFLNKSLLLRPIFPLCTLACWLLFWPGNCRVLGVKPKQMPVGALNFDCDQKAPKAPEKQSTTKSKYSNAFQTPFYFV